MASKNIESRKVNSEVMKTTRQQEQEIISHKHNDVVDGDVNELHEEADKAHHGKADGCGDGNLLQL